ncbi:MAG: hypothetical protein WEB53_07795 [Akkermansiaceae bacterium]
MSPLQQILATYRATSKTEREKGSYFEELSHRDSSDWQHGCPAR